MWICRRRYIVYKGNRYFSGMDLLAGGDLFSSCVYVGLSLCIKLLRAERKIMDLCLSNTCSTIIFMCYWFLVYTRVCFSNKILKGYVWHEEYKVKTITTDISRVKKKIVDNFYFSWRERRERTCRRRWTRGGYRDVVADAIPVQYRIIYTHIHTCPVGKFPLQYIYTRRENRWLGDVCLYTCVREKNLCWCFPLRFRFFFFFHLEDRSDTTVEMGL